MTADDQPTPPSYQRYQKWLALRSAVVTELRRRGLAPDDADPLRSVPPAMTLAAQLMRVGLLLDIVPRLREKFSSLTHSERELVARLVDGACRRQEGGAR